MPNPPHREGDAHVKLLAFPGRTHKPRNSPAIIINNPF
jgi:hypothetical protein